MKTICEATEDEVLKWKSNAEWSDFQNTTDSHRTKKAAEAACEMLVEEFNRYEPCPIRGHCKRAWVTKAEEV